MFRTSKYAICRGKSSGWNASSVFSGLVLISFDHLPRRWELRTLLYWRKGQHDDESMMKTTKLLLIKQTNKKIHMHAFQICYVCDVTLLSFLIQNRIKSFRESSFVDLCSSKMAKWRGKVASFLPSFFSSFLNERIGGSDCVCVAVLQGLAELL